MSPAAPGSVIYVNGDLLPAERARVPVMDRGYLYGEGLFETMRAYQGRIFALDRHLARLAASAGELGIEPGVGEEALATALEVTLRANGLADAYLRLTLSQQCDAPGVESRAGRFTITIIARPLAPARAGGMSAVTLAPGSAPPAALARHKTLSFLAYVRARAQGRGRGAEDALLVNAAGEITEATTANVFFVIGGALVTPPVECGLLPGITRAVVLELARAAGMEAWERPLRPRDVAACQECLLTNSVAELLPVTRLDGRDVGAGAPGPVFAALADAYAQLVASGA